MKTTPVELIERLADQAPQNGHAITPTPARVNGHAHQNGVLDVESWLTTRNVEILNRDTAADGVRRWFIDCPGMAAHTTTNGMKDCVVTQEADGRLGGKCFHSSCGMRSWTDIRDAIGKPTRDDYPPSVGSSAANPPDGHDETPEQAETAEQQQKLRHALQHGLKKLAEGHGIAEVAGAISTVLGSITANSKPQTFETLTSRELDSGAFDLDYFVADMLVKSQPCVLAGPKKCLKTNILIDLTLSLASQSKFLNEFYISRAVRVALVSGESGQATIQETARRVARSKPWINLADYENAFWCFDLPKLGQPDTAKTIIAYIEKHELDVLVLDPAYLCMPLGDSAGNLFLVGVMLADLTKVTAETGCTIILCHHTKKSVTDPFAAPELENISWSGFQEWARQWILLGRREAYDPEAAGSHRLWLSAGGSAGHSGLWALDIEEGSRKDVGGRRWDVSVTTASVAIAETIEQREEAKASKAEEKSSARTDADAAKLLKIYQRTPEGSTAKSAREEAGWSGTRFAPANAKLLNDKKIQACQVTRSNRRFDGFCVAGSCGTNRDAAGLVPLVPLRAEGSGLPPLGVSRPDPLSDTDRAINPNDSRGGEVVPQVSAEAVA